MRKSRTEAPDAAALRHRAEERLKERKTRVPGGDLADSHRLLHELEVHQIELEMQNEELRAARQEIEAGLARYTELFDFAPIGYLAIAGDGTIRELNLTAARLLGTERQRLLGRRLGFFVVERHRQAFNRFLQRVLTTSAEEQGTESCELSLAAEGTGPLEVRLTAAALQGSSATALMAVEDVTARKRAEAGLHDESRRKDEFLAILSHELRNPLAPIRTGLYVLERAVPGSDQALKAQAVLGRQVTHLT
ncbi:MAG: PAS domain S-box protein, partial [Deltaproteobacteria bacterium]|nr:PAS domain S-box protein [Deltaproteobacteria bacterium]